MDATLIEAVGPTCAAVADTLAEPPTTDLDAPTPCTDYDLRTLVEHFVGTSEAMARLGRGEPLDPADPWGGGTGAADGDWAARLRGTLAEIGRGWGGAEAWEGEAAIGGATMPRTMLGEMALVEVALHGWDVARALGRTVLLEPDVAAAVDRAVASSAALGRQMGVYAAEVPVPAGASPLDRALGKAGRDPGWAA